MTNKVNDDKSVSFPENAIDAPGQEPSVNETPKVDQPKAAPSEETPPSFITEDQFNAKMDEVLQQTDKTIERWTQSWSSKLENRMVKDVESRIAEVEKNFNDLRTAGHPVSDEMVTAAKQRIIADAATASQTPESSNVPDVAELTPEQQAVADLANSRANALMEKHGIALENTDPEAQAITATDPFEWVQQYEQALVAKKERIENQPAGTSAPRTPNILGAGGSHNNAILENLDKPSELIRQGLAEIKGR